MGKTRFVDEVLEALPLGVPAMRARAQPRSRAAPYGLLLELLLSLDAGRAGAGLAEALAARVGAPRDRSGEPIQKALELLLVTAERESDAELLVLVAEDIHRADRASLAAIRGLMRSEKLHTLLVVTTSRPALPASWADPERVERIHLPSLGATDRLQLARFHLRPIGGGGDLAQWVVDRSGGNPLAIEHSCALVRGSRDLLRAARLERLLHEVNISIPRSLPELVRVGLRQLSPARRELVAALALLDSRASSVQLSQLDREGRPPEEVERDLEALARLGIVRRDIDGTWEADGPWIHGPASELLTGSARAALHRRCAAMLRAEAAVDATPQRSARIARHYDRAGEMAEAFHFYRIAGEGALALGAFSEAVRSLRRVWTMAAAGDVSAPERSELALSFATALNALDHYAEAQSVLGAIEDGTLGGETVSGARLLIQLAWTNFYGGREIERSREAIERGLRWLEGSEEAGQDRLLARLYLTRIDTLDGNTGRALASARFVLRETARSGDPMGQAVALVYEAQAFCDAGQLRRARDDLHYALEIAEGEGNDLGLAIVSALGARVWVFAGDLEQARRMADRGRELGEATGQEGVVISAMTCTGHAQLAQGQAEAALATFRELVERYPEAPAALDYFAEAQLECRTPGDAADTARRCLEMRPARLIEIRARRTLGLAFSRMRPQRAGEALAEAQRSRELAEQLALRPHVAFARLALAEIAWVSGERGEAEAHLAAAREILADCEMPLPPADLLSKLGD